MTTEAGRSPAARSAIVPGLALVVGVALAARLIHGAIPPDIGRPIGAVIFAVALGLVLGNSIALSTTFAPGIKFSYQTVLRLAIVLLGAGLSFQTAAAIGVRSILVTLVLMAIALAVAGALGRVLGIPPKLATLIGVGTAICGNSAISATAPVIGAADEETSFAIATNTLLGTVAVFAYPALGHLLGLSDNVFGHWAGTAVNDTSQVVATSLAYSDAANRVAVVVKLTRNALMGPLIVGLGLWSTRGSAQGSSLGLGRRLAQSVPLFVVGFVLLAALNSLGLFVWLSGLLGRVSVADDLKEVAHFLILVALAGVGLGTRFAAMRRIGLRPFYVGLVTALTVSLLALLAARWLG